MTSLETALVPAGDQKQAQMIETASNRQAAEVQAAMVIAKRFPRDHNRAFSNIMQACKRRSLAEQACYEYPKGKEQIAGPSIRLAEALAQNWGNVDFGIVEMAQGNGESIIMAYCWDLETNTRQVKIFTVPHERHVGKGQNKTVVRLTDPRDIYEMTANQGARRLRSCILGIIPGDVVDAAVAECDKTLEGKNEAPIADRIRKMVPAFQEIGVTVDMIEAKLGHNLDALTEREMAKLKRQFTSIRDGFAKADDFFDRGANAPAAGESLAKAAPKSEPAKEATPAPAPAATPATETTSAAPQPATTETQGEGATDGSLPLQLDGQEPPEIYGQLAMLIEGNGIPLDKFMAWAVRSKHARAGAKALTDIEHNNVIGIVRNFDGLVSVLTNKKGGK